MAVSGSITPLRVVVDNKEWDVQFRVKNAAAGGVASLQIVAGVRDNYYDYRMILSPRDYGVVDEKSSQMPTKKLPKRKTDKTYVLDKKKYCKAELTRGRKSSLETKKTGGKIIRRVGGVVYIFRGRHYNPGTRPRLPVMLWKPATPVYPKLIQEAPEGLTKQEADRLRKKGKNLLPICKLAKNGVYVYLVRDVRIAFEGCPLVKIDCKGLHASDYKKIGAKLKELVPCVLLSFDDEEILMWRGKDWKSFYRNDILAIGTYVSDDADGVKLSDSRTRNVQNSDPTKVNSSPKMEALWRGAIESGKALLLDEINLRPDKLLEKVEEFNSISQVATHSYPATIISGEELDDEDDAFSSEDEDEDESYPEEDKYGFNELFDGLESSVPYGSLPIDSITEISETLGNDDCDYFLPEIGLCTAIEEI